MNARRTPDQLSRQLQVLRALRQWVASKRDERPTIPALPPSWEESTPTAVDSPQARRAS
jgi:hypothetical protein